MNIKTGDKVRLTEEYKKNYSSSYYKNNKKLWNREIFEITEITQYKEYKELYYKENKELYFIHGKYENNEIVRIGPFYKGYLTSQKGQVRTKVIEIVQRKLNTKKSNPCCNKCGLINWNKNITKLLYIN